MAAHIPSTLRTDPLEEHLIKAGLILIHQGKVRNTYEIPNHPNLLLSLATDRISIFDFVLNATVPRKGEVLTAMTIFWLTEVLKGFPHHLVACGRSIDQYLPAGIRNSAAIRKRAIVIKKLNMLPVECIVRGYLTGSGWKSYEHNGSICGIDLPGHLYNGSRLPTPIFTPTTKSTVGHDIPLSADLVTKEYGNWVREKSVLCYTAIADFAQRRSIILADTKLEFGRDGTLADEVGTPDSSRFWDFVEWQQCSARRTSPPPHDKERVRQWGQGQAINMRNPEKQEDLEFVDAITVPPGVIEFTKKIYLSIFMRLTGYDLTQYQVQKMGV